jgi:hypothetical protein
MSMIRRTGIDSVAKWKREFSRFHFAIRSFGPLVLERGNSNVVQAKRLTPKKCSGPCSRENNHNDSLLCTFVFRQMLSRGACRFGLVLHLKDPQLAGSGRHLPHDSVAGPVTEQCSTDGSQN